MKTDLEKLTSHDFIFFNLPQKKEREDYEQECNLLVENIKNNKDIKAVYLAGGNWVPGISDLDILIVYAENPSAQLVVPDIRVLSKNSKYLFLHNYGTFDESNYKNIFYLTPEFGNFKLIYGRDYPVINPQQELSSLDYRFLISVLVFDILINKFLWFLPKIMVTRRVDVRQTIGMINSLIYTLEMTETVIGKKIITDFPVAIKDLRLNWFNQPEKENLEKLFFLIKKSLDLVLELMVQLNSFVVEQKLGQNKRLIFQNRRYYIVFTENWSKEKFWSEFIDKYISFKKPFLKRKIENIKLVLPAALSYFFLAYADYEGPISDWIKNNLKKYEKNNIIKPLGLEKHIVQTNNFVRRSLATNGLLRIAYPYGLGTKKATRLSKVGEIIVSFFRTIKK